jgi:hypothetical protein
MFRRRRPVMRAAAVGGAAYHMGKNAQAGQDRAEAVAAEPAPEQPAGITDDGIAQLQKLAQLKEQGIITEAEFDEQKRKILGS